MDDYQERPVEQSGGFEIDDMCLMLRKYSLKYSPLAQMTFSFLPGGLPLLRFPSLYLCYITYAMRCSTSHTDAIQKRRQTGHATPWIIITLHTRDTPFRLSIVSPKRIARFTNYFRMLS